MADAGLNAILDRLAPLRHRSTRFLFAAALVIGALAFAAVAQFVFRPAATLLFAVAVIGCTGLFGLTAGLLSAALSALMVDFFFIPPLFQWVPSPATWWVALELGTLAVGTHFAERYFSNRIRRQKKVPLGIRGQLDGIKDGEVYGWAMDCDNPATPVMVTIMVDARPAAEVAAVYYRPDLEQRLHSSGSHGFYVDLSHRVAADKEAIVEARLSTLQMLENSPQKMRIPARARQNGPAVLFMHIPKTAGIAFREAIVANYRESEVAYLYGTPPGFLVGDLRRLPLEQRRGLRFVIGHFQYGIHHDLPQETLYVTVVREPAARMLSNYAFLQHTEPEVLKQGGRIPGLEELLERKPHIHFDNPLVRHFAGVDERAFPAGTINQEHCEAAIYYLQTGFLFVGHQEFAANAFAWMRQRFGWTARAELEMVNVGLKRADNAERARVREALQRHNAWDCRLYEEILRLFPYER